MKSGRIFFHNFKKLKLLSQNLKLLKPKLQFLQKSQEYLFSKHLFATNLIISTGFSAAGDVFEQIFEILSDEIDGWDKKRTLKLGATGLTVGVICHYWYLFLDSKYPLNTRSSIVKKIILNQLIFSPVCISVFFFTLGFINQTDRKKIIQDIIDKGKNIYIAEWIIWPPASMINFYFVPYKFRVLYDSVASLGFDIYNSYIVHRDLRKKKPTQTKICTITK